MSDDIELGMQATGTAVYEIRVAGQLGSQWSEWFAGLRVTPKDGDTLLAGPIDQAALHGVLRRVRDLGMPLISVARIEPAPSTQRISRETESRQ